MQKQAYHHSKRSNRDIWQRISRLFQSLHANVGVVLAHLFAVMADQFHGDGLVMSTAECGNKRIVGMMRTLEKMRDYRTGKRSMACFSVVNSAWV